jgi:hypothetical protein
METHTNYPFAAADRAMRLARDMTRLDLLADIDATVDELAKRSSEFKKASFVFSEIEANTNCAEIIKGQYLDPEDKAIDVFREAEEYLKAYIPHMLRKRASIDMDAELSETHRESLHNAYDEVLVCASMTLESVSLARQAIIRHDLAAEPRDGPAFNSMDELIADLHAS